MKPSRKSAPPSVRLLLSCLPIALLVVLIAGCDHKGSIDANAKKQSESPRATLVFNDARKDFKTNLTRKEHGTEVPPEPPAGLFKLVSYPSPVGNLFAYLSVEPTDGKLHPVIVWIAGGFGNDIGDSAWIPADPSDDQSASTFRKAGILMMYPSLRGGNTNPGVREGFFGEVDDVLSATQFLAQQPGVDPKQIYLGGHSTGGTLVLLVGAAAPEMFQGVFAFGPVAEISGYGRELPFDTNNEQEVRLRSPIHWLRNIRCTTYIVEGQEQPGNYQDLQQMEKQNRNTHIRFYGIEGKDHFSVLAPLSQIFAQSIIDRSVGQRY